MSTFADPSADKDREKSVTVEFVCTPQPVPPEALSGLPFRPVALEGMTVAPRAETSGQATWLTWTVRATGMTAPGGVSAEGAAAGKSASGGSAVDRAGAGCGMSGPGLPEGRPPDPAPPRGVLGPPWWVLSPLDYRTHVLAEGDQPGHHHEALYWAERKLEKAMLVTDAMNKGATSWNPWTKTAFFPQ